MQIFTPLTFFVALFTGSLGAYLAYKRGRNPYGWFFVGFFFGMLGTLAIFFAPKPKRKVMSPLPQLIQTLSGPTHKLWYYATASREQMGPVSHNGLFQLWKAGTIFPSTYVWNEELSEWKLLKEFIVESKQ
ncbi:MAG TPA: DUF4339 domain-containing protein [Chlamydiales bacterium]|nr:DUF4339 domain-containing protein [Chlamydiales bacterium]